MRKLSKKISMLMVLAMLVSLFSGVVSASAASAWSFASSKYDVAVNGSINMESKEYADFDLLKDGKAPAGYTVAWASSDEDVVWVNAKTGQLRANKFGKAADGDKAVISATFTNTATKKSATRSFTIVLGAAKDAYTVTAADATIALGEEVKFAPVVKNAAGKTVKFATHKSYNGYFLDGKAITNPWTPEEAGEYTVTIAQFAKKANVADLAKAVRKTEVKVTVTVSDFDAKATGLKEITVYGDFDKDAAFAVKKDGKQNITFTTTVAEDGKSAKLALRNKLYEGVYTVTYGEAKVDLAIEDEKVASIIVYENGGQLFTSIDKKEAYAHYDVLNQYGESVRKSYDVSWNTSAAGGVSPNASEGVLTIKKAASGATSNVTFNYNDPVVLTGVASGYGYAVSETASMTIGLEDNASTVKVLGVIKKDTTKILEEIPASFVGGTYQLVFEMYNRSGYRMAYDEDVAAADFTFTSLNPLLVNNVASGFTTIAGTDVSNLGRVYIDGVAYGVADITPGNADQIKAGGVAEIRVVSTKTGVTSTYNLRVVSEQILDSFKVLQPDFIIPKDGVYGGQNEVELKFEATDTEGAPITDFRALYKAVSFSTTDVKLKEQNDGTAKLFYKVGTGVSPTKESDYPVVFTAIVPGTGKSDNVKFSVKYGRVISSPIQYNGLQDVIEGNSLKIFLRDHDTWRGDRNGGIDWADQYDVKAENTGYFNDRVVAIKVLGNKTGLSIVPGYWEEKTNNVVTATGNNYYGLVEDYTLINPQNHNDEVLLQAADVVTKDVEEFAVEFVLYDTTKGEFVGGSDFVVTFRVNDLSQVTSFYSGANDALVKDNSKSVNYWTKGILANGAHISIPNNLTAVTGSAVIEYKLELGGYDKDGDNKVDYGIVVVTGATGYTPHILTGGSVVTNNNIFYDQSKLNAEGGWSDRKLTHNVTTTIKVNTNSLGGGVYATSFRDTAKFTVDVANYGEWMTSLQTKGYVSGNWNWTNGNTEATLKANGGVITYEDLIACVQDMTDNYADTNGDNNGNITITLTNVAEGTRGLYTGSTRVIKAVRNGLKAADQLTITVDGKPVKYTPMIEDAEIGDTFTATYEYQGAKHVIKITVGADQTAEFSSTSNTCSYR